jgi:glutathione synthase
VSELGTYGYLLGDGKNLEVYENQSSGHILRSKAEHVNEGGVAVGYAVIDTAFLV